VQSLRVTPPSTDERAADPRYLYGHAVWVLAGRPIRIVARRVSAAAGGAALAGVTGHLVAEETAREAKRGAAAPGEIDVLIPREQCSRQYFQKLLTLIMGGRLR